MTSPIHSTHRNGNVCYIKYKLQPQKFIHISFRTAGLSLTPTLLYFMELVPLETQLGTALGSSEGSAPDSCCVLWFPERYSFLMFPTHRTLGSFYLCVFLKSILLVRDEEHSGGKKNQLVFGKRSLI